MLHLICFRRHLYYIIHYHISMQESITIMYQLYKAHSNVHRSNSLTLHATLHTPLQSFNIHLASSFLFYIFFYHSLWLIHRGRGEGHTFHLSRVYSSQIVWQALKSYNAEYLSHDPILPFLPNSYFFNHVTLQRLQCINIFLNTF